MRTVAATTLCALAACLAFVASAGAQAPSTTSPAMAVCVPDIYNQVVQSLNDCEDQWLAPLDAALDEPLANAGDGVEWKTPNVDTCWTVATDPAWAYLDDGAAFHAASAAELTRGCSEYQPGGTTVYYHKQKMHDGYYHSGNYNHKTGHWMRIYHTDGCNYALCTFHLYMTNWRNRVKHNWYYDCDGPCLIGKGNLPHPAGRPYCGWDWSSSINQAHSLPTIACWYTYG
jgi:hypothetical protein